MSILSHNAYPAYLLYVIKLIQVKVGTDMSHKHENNHFLQSKYINRDLSWLEFNRRVLEEAQDPTTPLLEKLKFLSIVSSNLDEFMGVRVAGIQEQLKVGYNKRDFSGYTPSGLLKRIIRRTTKLVSDQYKSYRELLRQAAKEGIHFLEYDDLNVTQKKKVDQYYHEIIFPVLTPMAVDRSRPFPLVHNLGLYLSVILHKDEEEDSEDPYFSIVQVPSILSRFIELPRRNNSKKQEYILLENVISQHIHTLFSGYKPVAAHQFRVTRNADLPLNEEGAEDLLEQIEKELRQRRWGVPVRLEVERGIHQYALDRLVDEFEIEDRIFEIDGPLDLSLLMKFTESLTKVDHLRYERLEPVYPEPFTGHSDIFGVLRQQDVLVFHPYESFQATLDFIDQAANDLNVLAIKMNLYRVSGNSPLIRSLMRAAEAGKQVTVVVELKARFDEERNIAWAKELEKAGCHVIYGLAGLKTHAKITLVVRQEHDKLERYVHVGTGNYNENTARLYTDVGLFTVNSEIGEDASVFFNEITGYSSPRNWRQVAVAPTDLQDKLIQLIRREINWASVGKPARIIAKLNSLSSQILVDELYKASQAGVKIDLIVRGICCLRPGVQGLSENITVISIVDRYLEHTRLLYFENDGEPDLWLSSADWMTRNMTRRIELMCRVLNPKLKQYVINILNGCLQDNVKARKLTDKASHERKTNEDAILYRSQFAFADIQSWKS